MSEFILISDTRPLFRKLIPSIIFKVYYDSKSMRCIFKTTEPTVQTDYPYVEVEYVTYESIDICKSFKVINGIVNRIPVTIQHKKLIQSDKGTIQTIKNNMLFVVQDDFVGEIEKWEYFHYGN